MLKQSFDRDGGGIELSAETLIYSSFPDAATPQEALARLAAAFHNRPIRPITND